MRYLVLDKEGLVVNVIIWDGVSRVNWRDDTPILESDAPFGVTKGWKYVNGEWINPRPPEIVEPEQTEE